MNKFSNYVVYVLSNTTGKIYIGQTYDLQKRLESHNVSGTGYTSKYRPWDVVIMEIYPSRKEAMARERYLKTGVGRDWIKRKIAGA